MKGSIRSSWWLAAVLMLLLCCTLPALADDPQFAITSVTGSLWGEYTSPYGTDNAAVGSVVCDDFVDQVYIGTEHNYNAYTANSIISGAAQGIWSGVSNFGYSSMSLYEAAGALVLQIYGSPSGSLGQEEANWAVWALFDPSAAAAAMTSGGAGQAGCDAIFGTGSWSVSLNKCTGNLEPGGLISAALLAGAGDYASGLFNNLVVYVPFNKSLTGPCNSPGNCDSQEFFGMMPEGGSAGLYLLLAGVSCLGAMVYSRRQTARANMA